MNIEHASEDETWKVFSAIYVFRDLSYLCLQSCAFGKIGQALGLNLSAVATGGTEQNGAICPLDGNTVCCIFSLSRAFCSLYSSIFRCAEISYSHYGDAFGEHALVNSFDIRQDSLKYSDYFNILGPSIGTAF